MIPPLLNGWMIAIDPIKSEKQDQKSHPCEAASVLIFEVWENQPSVRLLAELRLNPDRPPNLAVIGTLRR